MNTDEAIKMLNLMIEPNQHRTNEAIRMAVQALRNKDMADMQTCEYRIIDHLWQCNKCGWRENVLDPPNYCPNCGSKIYPLMERRWK